MNNQSLSKQSSGVGCTHLFKKYSILIYSFFTAIVFLGIASKSSPLYPTNDWVDVHCFLTMGKGLLNGLIPYIDLYEQKGPVLYFVYAIVALFSQRNMFGQFLLEVITFGLFLYYSAKIAEIYLGKSRLIYLILPILSATVVVGSSFSHGGSVEQSCLFMFTYGLYTVLLACHENRPLTFREALTNGIYAGMLLWIKYTMLGFYIGLCLFVLIWYLIWIRNFKALLATIGQFLMGLGIVTAIVLVFFLLVGGLDELYTCYFYNNIFLYPNEDETPLFEKVTSYFDATMYYNYGVAVLLHLGLIWLALRIIKSPRDILACGLSFFALMFATYLGKGYIYYGLVFSAFGVFGLIGIARVIQLIRLPKLFAKLTKNYALVYSLIIALCFIPIAWNTFNECPNTYLLSYDKEDLPTYKFAKIINQTEDASILNFGFLDGGFYHAADVLPTCRFFCTFNIDAPGMWETQYQHVREGSVDYVITWRPLSNTELGYFGPQKLEFIASADFCFEETDFTYCLYKCNN